MKTIADLKQRADDALFAEDFTRALAHYGRIIELQPLNLDARLRVADTLMALGEVQSAAVVYTELAKHASRSGYPLRALVAMKILFTLEPKLVVLLAAFAKLYARTSEKLGRGVRRAPPDPDQALPEDLCEIGELETAAAEKLAADYERANALYPDKLMPIPVLSLLDADEFAAVLESIEVVRARPGTPIIQEEEPGNSFFVLTRGVVQVTKWGDDEPTVLATLHEGAIFGEMALLSASPRTATVTAVSDCDLLEFDRESLLAASNTVTNLNGALASFAQDRLLNNLMASATLFRPLDVRQRKDLMRRFVAIEAEDGTAIIREGEPGKGLYAVLRGEVKVSKDEGDGRVVLACLGPGEMFGEISLLNDEPTTATVSAEGKTTVLFLGRSYFERLMEAIPEIRVYLERLGEDRAMDTRISMMTDEEVDEPDDPDESIEIEILI